MKPSGLASISVFPLGVRNMGTFPYAVVQRRDTQCDSLIGHYILASPGIRELCNVRAERGMQRRIRGFRATGETRHVSEVCWELGRKVSLPKTEKSADLVHYFSGVAKFLVKKKSNIELKTERVNIRPELAFYWGNSPVNIRV